jgi:formate-dependent nitrite reductase membrane component NrfD
MTKLAAANALGVVLTLLIVYWMRPLNNEAVALLSFLCLAIANLVAVAVLRAFSKRKPEEEADR